MCACRGGRRGRGRGEGEGEGGRVMGVSANATSTITSTIPRLPSLCHLPQLLMPLPRCYCRCHTYLHQDTARHGKARQGTARHRTVHNNVQHTARARHTPYTLHSTYHVDHEIGHEDDPHFVCHVGVDSGFNWLPRGPPLIGPRQVFWTEAHGARGR